MVFALLVASVAVFVTFVVPGLIDPLVGMDGFEIPGPTKLLLAIADFVSNWWLVLTVGTIAAVFGFRTWASVPANRLMMDRLLLQVPLLGKLQRTWRPPGLPELWEPWPPQACQFWTPYESPAGPWATQA